MFDCTSARVLACSPRFTHLIDCLAVALGFRNARSMCRVPWTSCAERMMAKGRHLRNSLSTKISLASNYGAKDLPTELWQRKYGFFF